MLLRQQWTAPRPEKRMILMALKRLSCDRMSAQIVDALLCIARFVMLMIPKL